MPLAIYTPPNGEQTKTARFATPTRLHESKYWWRAAHNRLKGLPSDHDVNITHWNFNEQKIEIHALGPYGHAHVLIIDRTVPAL